MNLIKIILIISSVFLIINQVESQSQALWNPQNGCKTFNNNTCWTPSLPTPIDSILLGQSSKLTLNTPTTVSTVEMQSDSSLTIVDSTLKCGDILMGTDSRLTLAFSDEYQKSLATGNKATMTVEMNKPSALSIISNGSITMSANSILDVFRSISDTNGTLSLNDQSTMFFHSKQNGDSIVKVNSAVLTGTSSLQFTGQSYSVLVNKNFNDGIKLSGSSQIIATDADNIQITGTMALGDSSKIQLTRARLYLDKLSTSSASQINVVDSTLSIMFYNKVSSDIAQFSPQSANFKNSIFTHKTNYAITSPISMSDSIWSFNSTVTLSGMFTGSSVSLLLDNAEFSIAAPGSFSCSRCEFAIRNSTLNLGSFVNDGSISLSSSSINTDSTLLSRSGSIYGYYGNFSNGITMETGSLGVYNERTRLNINGNVIIQNGANIQLYLASPLDFSWLNITGSLDLQEGALIEVFIYIEISNNSVNEIIKTADGFVNSLSSNNVILYTYDPDNDIVANFTGCRYALSYSETSVFLSTNYSCQEEQISSGNNGLSKGALAGISLAMITLAAAVSFAVWFKTSRKSQKDKNFGMTALKSDKSHSSGKTGLSEP